MAFTLFPTSLSLFFFSSTLVAWRLQVNKLFTFNAVACEGTKSRSINQGIFIIFLLRCSSNHFILNLYLLSISSRFPIDDQT